MDSSYAYDLIDRYLRNNLGDDDYQEYSEALDTLINPPKEQNANPQTPPNA